MVAATYSNTSNVASIIKPQLWSKIPNVHLYVQFVAKALQDPGKNHKNNVMFKYSKIEALGKLSNENIKLEHTKRM